MSNVKREKIQKDEGSSGTKKKTLLMKMLLFIAIPAAILLCVTGVIVLRNVEQSVTQLTTSSLSAESQAAASQIDNYFSKYNEAVQQMVANDLFQQYFQKPLADKKLNTQAGYGSVKQTVDNIFKTDPENYSLVWIADCELNGLIMSSQDEPFYVTLKDRPWYQPAVDKKGIIFTEPYEDASSGAYVMSLIAPIFKNGTEELLGFAGIDITIDQLYNTMQNQKIGETGFCILASAEGQLIYHPDTAMKGKNVSESNMSENIINAIEGKTAGAITYTAMNQTNYGYLSPIGATGWTVTTGLPEKEFGAAYNSVQRSVIIIFTFALIILIILIISISKSIVNPLVKLKNAANQIADGDLDVTIGVESADEVGQVATALSRTVSRLKVYIEYIDEISAVLNQITAGDLTFELYCDYVGEFSKIKASLENIKSTLVRAFSEINLTADQVASGSYQVSNAAQSLAQGATEQASSIEELSASITEVSQRVKENAEAAEKARALTSEAQTIMQDSVSDMELARQAMDEISSASKNISKVIKTIDDIAFQTNILALNAAVEAARAGTAGKGFAVVADEVRNLSQKSAEAAKSTTALIESSIEAVGKGTSLVNKTSDGFEQVAVKAEASVKLVEEISAQAQDQAVAISQIALGVEQVSSVVQMNSATSEESAAASEELSSQAEALKNLVGQFKLEPSFGAED